MDDFKQQIQEDIDFIKTTYLDLEPNLKKDEFAFNFWVLTKLYDIDEELALNSITEYNDKAIDCFVHFEESKELFLIQNKYYSKNISLNRKEVLDFLTTPLINLENNKYKKSKELQSIFNNAIKDSEYKIWLHFYVTNNKKRTLDIESSINDFNRQDRKIDCEIRAKIFDIKNIYELYYGKSFQEDIKFDFTLKSINKGTVLQIKPKEYNLPGMSEAYYIMSPIKDLYDMYKCSINREYQLFEANIREYLGKSSINNGIIRTLRNKEDRKNFFYYNNGITILCKKTKKTTTPYSLTLYQPQIVNGCQTVNTIYEILSSYDEKNINSEFEGAYVMIKVLVEASANIEFYKNVVKYTNSQNSISEKAFGSTHQYFLSLQKHFVDRGFLLLVKPSDRNTFKKKYKKKTDKNKLIFIAKKYAKNIDLKLKNLTDVMIPLDKLLQVYIAYIKDGYFAYTKKNLVLKPNSEIYNNFSLQLDKFLTVDNMIRLFLFYKKAEIDKKQSDDRKTPIPYYLIGFTGYFIKDKEPKKLNNVLETLLNYSNNDFNVIYNYFRSLTNLYKKNYPEEYNIMVKKKIDYTLLEEQIETLETIGLDEKIKKFIKNVQ
jgi:hypothetical protein